MGKTFDVYSLKFCNGLISNGIIRKSHVNAKSDRTIACSRNRVLMDTEALLGLRDTEQLLWLMADS